MSRRTSRLFIGLILVLGLAYVAASWQAGRLARQFIEAWVQQANQRLTAEWPPNEHPVLRVASYQQGLFSSRIDYVLDYRDEQGQAQHLGLQDALQHGPWPWAALLEGHWQPLAAYSRVTPLPAGAWQSWFQAMPPGTPPWTLQARIGFDGHTSALGQLMPVRSVQDGLDFSGGTIHIDHDPAARRTTVSGQIGALSLKDADTGVQLGLEGLTLEGSHVEGAGSDRQTHQQTRLETLRILSAGAPEIVLQQQVLNVDMAQTGSLLDSRTDYGIAHLMRGTQDLGKIHFTASAEHLDVPALQALARILEQIDAGRAPDAELSAEDQQRLREGLLPVLAASPRLSLQTLGWSNGAGATELRAQADFRPVEADAADDPGKLIEQGIRQLSLHLQVSRPMLLQVLRQIQPEKDREMGLALASMLFDQFAERLQRLGLAQRADGDIVQSDLRYADGQVSANGKTMSPEEFLARLQAIDSGLF